MVQAGSGEFYNVLPTQNLFIPVNKAAVLQSKWVSGADTARILDQMAFKYPKDQLYKPDLAILNIIAGVAKQGWKRPIYFSAGFPGNSDVQGLDEYIEMEGVANKLVPIRTVNSSPETGAPQKVNTNKSLDLYLNKFLWGGADKKNIYFDEKNKTMMMTYRFSGAKVAEALILEGRKADAIRLLDKIATSITYESYQYDQSMWMVIAAYYHAGAGAKAKKYADVVARDSEKMISYIDGLSDDKKEIATDVDGRSSLGALQFLAQIASQSGDMANAEIWQKAYLSGAQTLNMPVK
jgi:hypothetical protein